VNFKLSDNPLATQSMLVTVDGQVAKAGAYPVVGRVTLMRAVALAGGTNEFAKLEDVVVFRDVGEKSYVGIYNLEGIRRGNYADPEIFPNDVIVVGDSPARRRFKDILQIVPALLSPVILIADRFRN
jgi:polysaccharide export outer membrane protein